MSAESLDAGITWFMMWSMILVGGGGLLILLILGALRYIGIIEERKSSVP